MSKVTTNKEMTLQATNFLPATEEAMDASLIKTGGSFLPYLEMAFPIMQDEIYEGHTWEIGFKNGSDFEPIVEGTVLSVFDVRKVIKNTYKNDNGETKNEYAYEPITRGSAKNQKTFNKTADRFEELLKEANDRDVKNVVMGNSVVTLMLFPDGKVAVANFAAFKTVHGYLIPMLSPAKFVKKAGLRIDLQNHKANLVKSKFGNHYPSVKKFSQWEHVILTPEQCKAGIEAINNVSESYENWLDS